MSLATTTVLSPPEDVADVRLLLARGKVFEVALEKAAGTDVFDLLAALDITAHRMAAGKSLQPIVELIEREAAAR